MSDIKVTHGKVDNAEDIKERAPETFEEMLEKYCDENDQRNEQGQK